MIIVWNFRGLADADFRTSVHGQFYDKKCPKLWVVLMFSFTYENTSDLGSERHAGGQRKLFHRDLTFQRGEKNNNSPLSSRSKTRSEIHLQIFGASWSVLDSWKIPGNLQFELTKRNQGLGNVLGLFNQK